MDQTKVWIERINRVIDHIEANLGNKLALDHLARVSGFSKYHFHRIFASYTGEPLYSFINRLRVERAAALLSTSQKSVTAIALDCGFTDGATFSRAFKKHFSISASEWKKGNRSKIHQDRRVNSEYNHQRKTGSHTAMPLKPMEVKEMILTPMHIAYIRYTGPFAGDGHLFASLGRDLARWARHSGLKENCRAKWVILYHDPRGITDERRLRLSFGMTVPPDTQTGGEIGSMHISGGRTLVHRCQLKTDQYSSAWSFAYAELARRGLQPGDAPSFEMYSPDCHDANTDMTVVDLCIPVQ